MLAVLLLITNAGYPEDAIQTFRSWFREYKKGHIDLYQSSTVPLRQNDQGKFRYFKTETVEEMDAHLEGLVKTNSLKATKLLVEAASFRFHRKPEVERKKFFRNQPWLFRAHALEALQEVTDPESLEWLRKRCLKKDSSWDAPFRKVIAATVLGIGRSPKDPQLLRGLLKDRNPRVRERALEGLGRVGSENELDRVIELLNDEHPAVRVAAVEATAGILAQAQKALPALAEAGLAAVIPSLQDTSWPVQEATLTLMERFRSKKSIPILIEHLERITSSSEQYRDRILHKTVEVLRSLTGEKIVGVDPGKWKDWWADNQDTFRLAPAPLPHLRGFQLDVPYFFNIPVNSDCIYFILDISGSMQSPLSADRDPSAQEPVTKLTRAREELLRTLNSLSTSVRFNIILFNDQVHGFSDKPVALNEKNIKKVMAFFETVQAEGDTNLFDALNLALEIKNMGLVDHFGDNLEFDTLFLLSDGVPTTGLVIDPEEILRIITRGNQLAKIKINTIYLGEGPSQFMRELANKNFGQHVHIQ
jgi:hypothetical protein